MCFEGAGDSPCPVTKEGEHEIDQLTIITKSNDFMDELYDAIVQYPKSEKYALGADTKNSFLCFYRLIIAAAKKYFKKTTLHDADVELFVLKHFIRMAYDRHYISIKRYARLCAYLEEIGKMLGGWIKSVKKK